MIVNGKNVVLQAETSLEEYLSASGYNTGRIAVEKNGVVVPHGSFASETLRDSDTLEIVRFVGGG